MKDFKPASYRAGMTALTLIYSLYFFKDSLPWYVLLALAVAILVGNLFFVRKIEGQLKFPNLPWWWYFGVIVVVAFFVWFVYFK